MLLLLLLLLQSQMLSAESAARAQQVEELEAALAGREAGDQVAGGQGTWGQGWGGLFTRGHGGRAGVGCLPGDIGAGDMGAGLG